MGRTAYTEPQCLYKGALYLYLINKGDSWESPYESCGPYLLTPWSRVLLEKLTGFQLVKKFPAIYGIRRFTTAFTCPHHLTSTHSTFIYIHVAGRNQRSKVGESFV